VAHATSVVLQFPGASVKHPRPFAKNKTSKTVAERCRENYTLGGAVLRLMPSPQVRQRCFRSCAAILEFVPPI